MESIGDSIRRWAAAPRPLRKLSKADLFKYPDADPSEEAGWRFVREALARRDALNDLDAQIRNLDLRETDAMHRVGAARTQVLKAKQAPEDKQSKEMVAMAERAEASAKAHHARLEKQLEELKAKWENMAAQDDMLSHEELVQHYRAKFNPDWQKVLEAWKAGTLMVAQSYGWASFLEADRKIQAADTEAFINAQALATLIGEEKSDAFRSMNALWQVRVMPAIYERREFISEGASGGTISVASLKPEQKRRYWAWWRHYNLATLKFQWADDSGVAYDNTMFNPTEVGEQERIDA